MSSAHGHRAAGFAWISLCTLLAGAIGCQPRTMEVPKPSVSAVPELVTVTQVKEWMDRGIPLAFVDSRSATAWEAGSTKARGALRVPPAEVSLHLEEIPRDHRIIVYCT